ncbi:GntR family transcriptional regulator [Alkalibacillus haloalkaliphilus]|uniref:GntR family transcriptional regulator n=1 Tax=Alkalibacillus haloalkaliphilus TaxID=94136 RepID=UPI0029357ABE|nr:GntR family transcriptional regulator [Alkalibacillus haloalkaliphilus]MDV2582430.1 GntR family transcriptional regulator [Alkalibacillus haloalkaliphilus]
MFNNRTDTQELIGKSLPDQISNFILKKILREDYKAGEKIVEENIARELNTSRAPVREALYLLQVKGMVDRVPRRGTIVKPFTDNDVSDYLVVMIGIIEQGISLSQNMWTDENKEKFKALYQDTKEKYRQQDVIEYQDNAEKLFRFVLDLTDNRALIKFYEEANQILNVFAQVQWDLDTMEGFAPEFDIFVNAILESNFDQAKIAVAKALKKGKG